MATVPLDDLLRLMIEEKASDLHVSVGAPPVFRVNGRLIRINRPALKPEDTATLALEIGGQKHLQKANNEGSVDFGVSYQDTRFRVSVYRERGYLAIAVRLLPTQIMTLEEIGVPLVVSQLLASPQGLILLTGPTGSGKTTSLASMIDVINTCSDRHILTIEDPIEYLHTHKKGVVNQREIGTDVPTFAEGIRRGMRQDPDVIMVGEMRDLPTMEAAVTAAETGHLVFSTAHTTGSARTVDRIIDSFPPQQQEQVRIQLASTLKAVVSQLLLPRKDGKGRIAAFEILVNTPAVAALIRENKTFRLTTEVQTGTKYGMISLEQSLVDLYSRGLIGYEEVMNKAQDTELAAQLAAKKAGKKR